MYLHTNASRNTVFSASRLSAALVIALGTMGAASAATLSVGPGKTYAAPCAAFAAAKDGDTIEITGNTTYSGDVCYVSRNNLTIRGVNGRPKIDAAGKNAGGKGTWVVTGANATIENVEMYGAKVPDRNGAAIRLEGTKFTMRQSFLHDNQNGILVNENMDSDLLIEFSEFGHNGYGDGQTHNLYVGRVKSLTFRYNFSHDANVGHNLKSRANVNGIYYNRFSSLSAGQTGSTAAGKPSYEIDLPNAGTSYIVGNVIQQPAANSNGSLVAYGEEGAVNSADDLYVVNNTFLNENSSGGTFLFIGAEVTTPALVQNNILGGVGNFSTQSTTIDKTNYRSASPGFVNRAAYDLRPTANAMVIDAGSDPGKSAAGASLLPTAQYKATASGESRAVNGKFDIGAYEAGAPGTAALAATPTLIATPSPYPLPSATETWTNCSNEGGTCYFSGKRWVRYGANGKYTTKIFTDSVLCAGKIFGDPIWGVAKTCSYAGTILAGTSTGTTPGSTAPGAGTGTTTPAPAPAATNWISCANEGGTCKFSGTRQVRYGLEGNYVIKSFADSAVCSNAMFGDPAWGKPKSCSYADTAQAGTTAIIWTTCASEGGTCKFSGTREVRYGANGVYATKTFTGSSTCSNSVYGRDPIWGVAKTCSYSSVTQ